MDLLTQLSDISKKESFLENIDSRDYLFPYLILMQNASSFVKDNRGVYFPGDTISTDGKHHFKLKDDFEILVIKSQKFWKVYDMTDQGKFIEALNFLDYKGPYEKVDPKTNNIYRYILTYSYLVSLVKELRENQPVFPYIISMSKSKTKVAGIINQNVEIARKQGKQSMFKLQSYEVKGDNPYYNYRPSVLPQKETDSILKNYKHPQDFINSYNLAIDAAKREPARLLEGENRVEEIEIQQNVPKQAIY